MKKSWIAAGCALTGLVLAYSALQTQDKKQPSKEPVVPVKIENSPSLEITFQPYTLFKNQKDGERDLVKLAEEAVYEGAWVFKPTTSEWHHVSSDHEETKTEEKVAFTAYFDFEEIIKLGSPSVFYHIHPAAAAEKMSDTIKTILFGKEESETEVEEYNKRAVASLCAAAYIRFPSKRDFEIFVSAQTKLGNDFEAKIATPLGLTKVKVLDPSQNTIDAYVSIWENLFVKIVEHGLVLTEIEGEPIIEFREQNLVDKLNEELKGKVKFELVQTKDLYKN